MTPGLFTTLPVEAVGGADTVYNGIIRACPAANEQVGRFDSEEGWGP